MRQSYGSALAPDGSAIAYIVRDGGYPYAVRARIGETGPGEEEVLALPLEGRGSVTRVLYSPDGQWIACEVSPKGSERLVTWVVPADGELSTGTQAKMLHSQEDVLTTLVEWDGDLLAMNAVTSNGVTEARLVDPRTDRAEVLDRRTDSLLVAAEQRHALMRVGPRGSRELLLITPDGQWLPLLPPDPGSMTETGIFLPDPGEDDLAVIVCTDHHGDRRRVVRLGINDGQITETEVITNGDAEVDEFVISEDLSTAAVLWNLSGISALELLALAPDQSITMRRTVELDGMVASGLSITDDGGLLSLTVEGPNLPPTVEIIVTDLGQLEHLRPAADLQRAPVAGEGHVPELVHFTARDGLELSGWLYQAPAPEDLDEERGPQPTYIHLHGGPEGQSRPINHDVLTALIDSGITVFTPNIRGSRGSGRRFQHADDRYGRFAAINDVADTAYFLMDAGVADPARLALGGRSYGGYLSLMVAAHHPELFTGIIDACGMTSFHTYFQSTEPWLASAAYPKYGYPMHDAELLLAISPLHLVDQIQTPVLFLHGEWDGAVPPAESRQMEEALARRGVASTFLPVPGEGHQFLKPRSRRLIAEAMLEFLCERGLSDTIDLGRFRIPAPLPEDAEAASEQSRGEAEESGGGALRQVEPRVVIRKGRGIQWLESR